MRCRLGFRLSGLLVMLALSSSAPALSLALPAQPALAASFRQPQGNQGAVFDSRVEMVLLRVAVFDAKRVPVPGLTKADFKVFEDGREQDIKLLLTPNETPLDIAFVMDVSGSIQQDAPSAKRDAYKFVDALSTNDCVHLVLFNERVGPDAWGPGADRQLKDMIFRAPLGGGTALYDAIVEGLAGFDTDGAWDHEVEGYSAFGLVAGDSAGRVVAAATPVAQAGSRGAGRQAYDAASRCFPADVAADSEAVAQARRQALVVLTDGLDLNSISTFSETVLAAWRADVPIFPIAAGGASRSLLGGIVGSLAGSTDVRTVARMEKLKDQLGELARITGGRFIKGSAGKLRQAYDEVLNVLRASYVVGYAVPPAATPATGSEQLRWHEVAVKLAPPKLRAVTRSGYYRTQNDTETARGSVRGGVESLHAVQPELALLQFGRAAAADPSYWPAHYYRAVTLSLLGREEEAREAAQNAVTLAPEVARAQELAWLTAYASGDYATSWEHLIRARHAGLPMTEAFELLRAQGGGPADLQARLDAPRVFVEDPDVPDLEVQAGLNTVMRVLRRALSESAAVALVSQARRADYLVALDADKFSGPDGRGLDGRLEVFGLLGERISKQSLKLSNVGDPAAVAADLRSSIAAIEAALRR